MIAATQTQLEGLYNEHNSPKHGHFLRGEEEIFLARLTALLDPAETVSCLIAYNNGYRSSIGKQEWSQALMAVTSTRVLLLYYKGFLRDFSFPYAELSGVSGRRELTALGLSRQLFLHRRNGCVVKIQGLLTKRSTIAQEEIVTAMQRWRSESA
ncbi:MAG: hypothetical protein ACRDYX_16035 [Egibacteraceae bacterium]